MPATVTVTGDVGPGLAASAVVITNVTEVKLDVNQNTLFVKGIVGSMAPTWHEFDVKDQNTVTVTKSGNTWTITVAA